MITNANTMRPFDEVANAVRVGMMFAECVVNARAMLDDPRMADLHEDLRAHAAKCESFVVDAANLIIARKSA